MLLISTLYKLNMYFHEEEILMFLAKLKIRFIQNSKI